MAGQKVAGVGDEEGGVGGGTGLTVAGTHAARGVLRHPLCLFPMKTSILRTTSPNLTRTRSKT